MKDDQGKPDRVEDEVAKTLASLDDFDTIDTGSYFLTRLEARIKEGEAEREPWLARVLLGSRLAPALMTLVIVVNGLTAWTVLRPSDDTDASSRQENVEAIADEYLLTPTDFATNIQSE